MAKLTEGASEFSLLSNQLWLLDNYGNQLFIQWIQVEIDTSCQLDQA